MKAMDYIPTTKMPKELVENYSMLIHSDDSTDWSRDIFSF